MTIAQELKVVQNDLCDARKERDALADGLDKAKAQIAEANALVATQVATITSELEGVKVQRDTAIAEAKQASEALSVARAELDAAKAKLEMAAFKDVGAGQPPVKDAAAGEALDVVALVDGAEGAEKMRLYRQHKAAYDAAKR